MSDKSKSRNVEETKKTLADGTLVKESLEREIHSDGTVVSKSRTSRSYPSRNDNPLKKSIQTSITRTDANGVVLTTTSTEELITAPDAIEAEPNSTETHRLPDGSGMIITKTANILADGSLSTVVTKVHVNRGSKGAQIQTSNRITPGLETIPLDEHTPRLHVLHSEDQPSKPPGFHNHTDRDDYDARLKRKQGGQNTPGIEMICPNDSAAAAASASVPGVHMIVGPDSRSKAEDSKIVSGVETIVSGVEEPIPMTFQTANATNFVAGVALVEDMKQPANMDKAGMKSSLTTSVLETIDNDYAAPTPLNFHRTTITENSKTLDLESGPINKDNKVPSTDELKPEKSQKWNRWTFGSNPASGSFRGDYTSDSNANLAVATPVMDEADFDKPTYEAIPYEAKTPLYKTKKCTFVTLALLAMIAVIVSVTVTMVAPKIVDPPPVEYVTKEPTSSPTLPPTSPQDVILTKTIESGVLKRNAAFSNMTKSDYRLQALNWILRVDELKLGPTDPNLGQRYTLALMAYRLDYTMWFNELDLNATDDAASDEIIDWLSPTDACDWFGVTCVDGLVTEIDLSSNQLVGEIPPEIANLGALEKLDLSENCIYGSIPSELGLLTNLYHLDINSNGLSGMIPEDFFRLSQLSYLDMSWQSNNHDNCTASDGRVVEPLYKMGDEGLGWNYGLESNFLENIGRLKNLVHLNLDQNYFTGSIPDDIKSLQQLEYLSGGGNWFNGTIPSAIGMMPTLKELWMSTNNFSGALPENIGNASELQVIYLWVNEDGKMNGTLPDSFYNLTKLKSLSISGHAFTGEIKTEIGNMVNLTSFKISRNQFSGTLPSELGRCEKLGWIQIHGNDIGGSSPDEVCALRSKNLNPAYTGQPVYQADCAPENGVPFFECNSDCCTTCCAHSTQICSTNS